MNQLLLNQGWRARLNLRHIKLGDRLKRKFWGKGFATEVSRLLVEKAFQDLRVETVYATAMAPHSDYIESEFPGENKLVVKYVITRQKWQSVTK